MCRARFGGDGAEFLFDRRYDLLVDRFGKRVAVRFRCPPPQHMDTDRTHYDRCEDKTGNRQANANSHDCCSLLARVALLERTTESGLERARRQHRINFINAHLTNDFWKIYHLSLRWAPAELTGASASERTNQTLGDGRRLNQFGRSVLETPMTNARRTTVRSRRSCAGEREALVRPVIWRLENECSGQTECRRRTTSSSFRAHSFGAAGRWRARHVSGRGVRSVGRVPHRTGLDCRHFDWRHQ